MSTKTTISQSRIVNTNSSGIITIVIDDDSDSNAPKVIHSMINRSPIGVQNPVSIKAPKFNTNNEQKVLITENKNNVILVNINSNSSQVNGSTRITSSSSSTRVSSEGLPMEVISKHNHVGKSNTHYVMINKPKQQTPNTSVNRTSSSTITSSPSKLRLWTQQSSTNQSIPRSPVIRSTVRTKHRVLPPEDTESDCISDQDFFKYLNLIPTNDFKTKTQIDLKVNWPLRNVARIGKPEINSNGKLMLSNLQLIRTPIPTTPDCTQAFGERKMRWYKAAQSYNERLQKFKADLPSNIAVRTQMQSGLESLHKRLMNEKQKLNEEEERYRKMKNNEQRKKEQREEQKQELEVYTNSFEWTSLMGQRVRNSAPDSELAVNDIYLKNCKIEQFCKTKDVISSYVPLSTKSSTRITRSNTGFAGIDKMWGPRSESHEYCFTRKQRLEKYLRLETGLNWKSRIIAMQCKSVGLGIKKITRCPCCLELVEPEWGHSCRDSDYSDVDEVEVYASSVKDSNDNDLQSDNDSEIITAGNVLCYECGEEECNGNCAQVITTPITKISVNENPILVNENPILVNENPLLINENPILVFASNPSFIPLKPKIEDKMTVQKVPALQDSNNNSNKRMDCNAQRNNDQKRRLNNEQNVNNMSEEESDDDIVIVQEVRNNQCFNSQKANTEPVIVRISDPFYARPLLKRKYSDSKPHHLPQTNTTDVIVVKKLK